MSNRRGGLGRGLGAIFTSQATETARIQPKDIVQEIFVSAVQPNRYQPRKEFNPDALRELADSIKVYGILQPVIVRKLGVDSYELIAGERRLRASKLAGLEKIPAIIREYTDAQSGEISIIENIQRQDLNAIEEAQAYERLVRDFGLTQEQIAEKVGRSGSYIANILRLLKLTPQVKEFVATGLLNISQARPLLAIDNEDLQLKAAQVTVAENLSVKNVEAFVEEMKNSGLIADNKKTKKTSKTAPTVDKKIFRKFEDELTEIIGAQVRIVSKQIQINFSSDAELMKIVEKLENSGR